MKQLRIIPLILFLLCSAGLAIDGKSASLGTIGEKPAAIKQVPPGTAAGTEKGAAAGTDKTGGSADHRQNRATNSPIAAGRETGRRRRSGNQIIFLLPGHDQFGWCNHTEGRRD